MKNIVLTVFALFATISAIFAQSEPLADTYNRAVAAFNGKDYTTAATAFETVIDTAIDSSDVTEQEWVGTAKQFLPRAYFMMGGAAVQQGSDAVALEYFTRSAELAELYGNLQQANQSKQWIANVYMKQGGEAFNAQDYPTAISIYSKGYQADPRNTKMALNLAMSHAELGMASLDWKEYATAMQIYSGVAALDNPKFADDATTARDRIAVYTNNMVAKLQGAFSEKNYATVLTGAHAAVVVLSEEQTVLDEVALSNIYFLMGAAHNARDQKPQAIAAFRKVTAGPNVAAAKAAVEQLSKTQ